MSVPMDLINMNHHLNEDSIFIVLNECSFGHQWQGQTWTVLNLSSLLLWCLGSQ